MRGSPLPAFQHSAFGAYCLIPRKEGIVSLSFRRSTTARTTTILFGHAKEALGPLPSTDPQAPLPASVETVPLGVIWR